MDTTDTESVEDESEYPQQPYVDIEAVNCTLTELHQQYNNLLLKYSNALNIIDELKCQLACGITKVITDARDEYNEFGLREGVHFCETADTMLQPYKHEDFNVYNVTVSDRPPTMNFITL
ncbi:hypothetical protein HPB50_025409 [Hyalomma asiaticum]|uniref:Uncharacterized protein n=1 Tax=Hyalomma asiaticum TaxID=266040 RepID=A0ACB7TPA7_HYAAI|nr:hypothetical protein HPB50_025409 [Hyalomma asiaticum]